MAVC
jgi:ankyrin repeat protein